MFVSAGEWTINTSQITYIYNRDDGTIEIYFTDGKKIILDREESRRFKLRLADVRN